MPLTDHFVCPQEPLTANQTNTVTCTSYGSNPPAVISWWLDGVKISNMDSQVSQCVLFHWNFVAMHYFSALQGCFHQMSWKLMYPRVIPFWRAFSLLTLIQHGSLHFRCFPRWWKSIRNETSLHTALTFYTPFISSLTTPVSMIHRSTNANAQLYLCLTVLIYLNMLSRASTEIRSPSSCGTLLTN